MKYVMDWMLEEKAIDEWRNGYTNPEMLVSTLAQLVKHGFTTCDTEYCESRDTFGAGCCSCIRSVFPSPEFYRTYCELRELYLKHNITEQLSMIDVSTKEHYGNQTRGDNS